LTDPPLASLITITATDGLLLPTLFYQPAKPNKRAVIWLHGMGSSGVIYSTVHTNALAQAFVDSGTAFIAMQNRGAGMLQGVKLINDMNEKEKHIKGTSHELIAECVHDIDGAIAFAKTAGYTELYLAGHSTGANKIALYNYLKPKNPFDGCVIYGGGDDTGMFYEELGPIRFKAALAESKRQIEAGHGEDLAPFELLDAYFSYQSAYDILDPDGGYNTFPYFETQHERIGTKPLWREFKSIAKPSLVIYGAEDEFCKPDVPTCLDILKREASPSADITYQTIPGGDHGCYQHEPELAQAIAGWINKL
jgi:pimeloyl-ACP methyl ester carboxylesterase